MLKTNTLRTQKLERQQQSNKFMRHLHKLLSALTITAQRDKINHSELEIWRYICIMLELSF